MAPEQRDRLLGEEGRANAASFDSAFQSAYGRQQQQDIKDQDRERVEKKLQPFLDKVKDVKSTPDWLKATSQNPLLAMDPELSPMWMQVGKSLMTHDAIQTKSEIALDTLDIKQQQVDNQSAFSKISVNNAKKFTDMLGTVTDPAEQTRIQGLTKNGQPTDEAWQALMSAPRQTERERIAERQITSRENIADKQISGRMALQKAKEDAAMIGKGGRVISEDEFVNRHLNKVFDDLYKENDNQTDAKKRRSVQDLMADADMNLRALYKASRPKQAAKPDPAAPAATPSTGTNDVSFDDFQQWRKK